MKVSESIIEVVKRDINSTKIRKMYVEDHVERLRRELKEQCEYLNSLNTKLIEFENFVADNG